VGSINILFKYSRNSMADQNEKVVLNESPPILKTWPRFYFVVSANLILLLVVFYTFTKVFE